MRPRRSASFAGAEINIARGRQQALASSAGDINRLGGRAPWSLRRRCRRAPERQELELSGPMRAGAEMGGLASELGGELARVSAHCSASRRHKHWQTAELSRLAGSGGREPSTTPAAAVVVVVATTTTTSATTTAPRRETNNTLPPLTPIDCVARPCYRCRLGAVALGGVVASGDEGGARCLDCNNYDNTKSETLCAKHKGAGRHNSSLAAITSVCHAPTAPSPSPSSSPSPALSERPGAAAIAAAKAATTETEAATTRATAASVADAVKLADQIRAHQTGEGGGGEAEGATGGCIGAPAAERSSKEEASWLEGEASRGRERQQSPAMEILRHHHQHQQPHHRHHPATSGQLVPKTYPNNTLLVDLAKCHRNIGRLWPPTHSHLDGCWPLTTGSSACPTTTTTAAKWRPTRFTYHMPESLLRNNPTLTLDDYDKAISMLTGDIRYQLHLLLYRRVQPIWLLLTTILCTVVPTLLLAHLETLMVVGVATVWLSLQLIGAFVTGHFRAKLDEMLEKSVAQVNTYFMDHNLMLGVINAGSFLSKSRLIIPILYFDTNQCREQIESIISIDSSKDASGNEAKHTLDYSKIGLPTSKPHVIALAQSQLAKKIVLRYSQRWISLFDKRKLMFTDDRIQARHLSTGKCLCQFIEEHFRNSGQQQQQQQVVADSRRIINEPLACQRQFKTNQLVANGKQAVPLSEPIVIGLKDAHREQTAIPTLSKLVSAKENNPQHKIDMSPRLCNEQTPAELNGYRKLGARHLLTNFEHNYHDYYHLRNHQHHQPLSLTSSGQTLQSNATISSADISLENGGENVISRSDELVKKLRLLLELRKNELQGIDGSLFSAVLYKAQQQIPTELPTPTKLEMVENDNNNNLNNSTTTTSREDDKSLLKGTTSGNANSSAGKRFYTQREGLFFLGPNSAKKSQQQEQQQQENRNHILEIC